MSLRITDRHVVDNMSFTWLFDIERNHFQYYFNCVIVPGAGLRPKFIDIDIDLK